MAVFTTGTPTPRAGLADQAITLTLTVEEDGTDTDIGTITIGVVDGNGDEVVASGTAVTDNADGTYSYTLAAQPNPDQLTVTWSESGSTVLAHRLEILGGILFTEAQARTFNAKADASDALVPLKSATEYPDATLADERYRIINDLEYWTGRGWVARYCRLELQGNASVSLDLSKGIPRTSDGYALFRPGRLDSISQILSVTVGGTSVATSNFKVDGRHLIRTDQAWTTPTITNPFNTVVEYVYGMPYPVDSVDRIALKLLVDRLVPSAFPERMITADTEYGTIRYVQPGGPMNNVSRIPEVNDWVNRHDHRVFI